MVKMASSNGGRSFIDSLTWLHCSFCATRFSRITRFFLLSCKTVACITCAKKMRSKTDRNKLDCGHCNSTVDWCEIHEEMTLRFRKYFESPDKTGHEMCHVHDFQLRLLNLTKKAVNARITRLTEKGNEARHKTSEGKKVIEKLQTSGYRIELERVMSEQHLEDLLKFSEDQLRQMDYSRIMHGERRSDRSSSRGTRSSLLSHGSRSSSKQRHRSSTPIHIPNNTTINTPISTPANFSTPPVEPNRTTTTILFDQDARGYFHGPVRRESRHREHYKY